MRDALERLLPTSRPPEELDAAIEAIPAEGNPTHEGGRVSDMRALMVAGRLIDAPRLVVATGNARCALAIMTRLPAAVSRVEFVRGELVEPARGFDAEGRDPAEWSGAEGTPTCLLIDAMDLDRHLAVVEAELAAGGVRQVLVYNSMLSRARRVVLHAEAELGARVEHVPLSEGVTAVWFEGAAGQGLAPGLREIAAEARWHPGRYAEERRWRPKGKAEAKHAAGKLLRMATGGGESERELAGRVAGLVAQVAREGGEAQPTLLRGLHAGGAMGARPAEAAHAALALLECGGEQERALRFICGKWHAAACERARGVLEGKADLWRLASVLYQVREVVWWSRYWDARGNPLWRAAAAGRLGAQDLRPLPVKPLQEYMDYYWLKGQGGALLKGSAPVDAGRARVRPEVDGRVNHRLRISQAASLCGFLLNRIAERFPGQTVRWLDVGCGNGSIANGADIDETILDRVEVVGIDFGASRVSLASRAAARNRRFIGADGLEPPPEIRGTRFHLVTAFEMLEHVTDPVGLLASYLAVDPAVVAAGSPLDEDSGTWTPSKGHVWSFKRSGYEAVFREAGLDVAMSSEVRVGTYSGGNDWLTVVGTRGGFEL